MRDNNYLYNHEHPFSEKLAENLKKQVTRVENNKASLLILDGLQGEGKTTLLVHIMDYINSIHGLPPVKLELADHPQISMGGKEFTKNFRLCKEQELVILGYDEAGDFNKRGAMSGFNQMLNQTFRTFRGFKIIIVLALPNFNILDNWLFDNGIPRGLIHCYDRSPKQGNFSAYSLVGMNWIRYWFDKMPKGNKYKCYSHVEPNFRGHFIDLPPERSKALDKLSTRGKERALLESEVQLEGLYSMYMVGNKLNRSIQWVRKAVADLKLKYDRKINRVNYFSQSQYERIVSYLDEHTNRKK